jgi:ABC-type multidrug transport system ATPase subunit
MPIRTVLVVGAAPGSDVVLQGPGVAPRHVQLTWRDGLVLQDLGQGPTSVDGRALAPGESVQLPGFHAVVMLGGTRFVLNGPEIAQLFVERSPLPPDPGAIVVGRDPARAHVLLAHPTVSGAHLRIDVAACTVTDLGSRSGTFDRNSQRLPAQQPVPLDLQGGYFFGMAWVPTSVLLELGRAPAAGSAAVFAAPQSTALPGGGLAPIAPPPGFAQGPVSAPGVGPASPSGPHGAVGRGRTVFGEINLANLPSQTGPRQAIVGRLPTNEIVLPYPQVSARHASIARAPDGSILVTDLGSTNGTYVNGARIPPHQPVAVRPGERIFVGPYPMIVDLDGETIRAYIDHDRNDWTGNLVEVEALDLFLEVPDRENKAQKKVLLDHVTFKARPGDLIALMGPSGAGKTTLLTVLNGYLRPTSGEVRVNGENLYAIYDALRGSIGYVPQDDIVHPELTVFEAIKYSAQFRLPSDYSDEEINRRVEQVIKDLGLEQVKHLEIGKPERKVLSGGQRKRVNIALELVTDPALMFLDEPTSGLAADDTVALIDLLSNLAKKYGKTIIVTIHQPAREEYEKFNLALIMGYGGEPVYYGPTGRDSYEFFGRYVAHKGTKIDNPRDMFDLLKQREEEFMASGRFPSKPAARLAAAQAWRTEYYKPDNPVYRRMYSGARQPGTPGQNRPPTRARVPLIRQFRLLLERYAIVKRRDRAGTIIMLAQAPIIGVLLALVFANPMKSPNMWCRLFVESLENGARRQGATLDPACLGNMSRFPEVADFSGAIFFLAIASIWFGTSNAAREIVAEQAIYRRERMVNLSIFNYVASKFALLSILCIVQCTVLLGIVYPAVGLGGGDWDAFPTMLGMMILTAMCAVAIGLLLSTVVVSSEAAMALTPIALIPQVVLGGRMVPMTSKSWLKPVMSFIPARWSFEGLLGAERDAVAQGWRIPMCIPSGPGVENGFFQCALEEVRNTDARFGGLGFTTYDTPAVQVAVLAAMTVVVIATVMLILRRRDSV